MNISESNVWLKLQEMGSHALQKVKKKQLFHLLNKFFGAIQRLLGLEFLILLQTLLSMNVTMQQR